MNIHDKKINSLSLHGHTLVSSSSDSSINLWDARMLPPASGNGGGGGGGGSKTKRVRALARLPMITRSAQSAYFDPAGSGRVLVTSYDDAVSIWDCNDAGKPARLARVRHNNHTGRWVMPFRARWTPAGDGFVIGSMSRTVEVFGAGAGADGGCERAFELADEKMTAIPARNAMHPRLPVIAAGTNSGRIHIWR